MDKKLLSYKVALYLVAVVGIGSAVWAYYGDSPRQAMPEPSPPQEEAAVPSLPTEEVLPGELSAVAEDFTPENMSFGVAVLSGEPINVVGSRTGTSTPAGVVFTNPTATTTYSILLDPTADNGVFTINPVNASTTPDGILRFSLLMSSDTGCDTATTTTSQANTIVTGDIKWFDAGNYIRGASQDNPLAVGTTTINYTGVVKDKNKAIIVERLNSRCLALQVNGSSTEAWIQFKQNSK